MAAVKGFVGMLSVFDVQLGKSKNAMFTVSLMG